MPGQIRRDLDLNVEQLLGHRFALGIEPKRGCAARTQAAFEEEVDGMDAWELIPHHRSGTEMVEMSGDALGSQFPEDCRIEVDVADLDPDVDVGAFVT